MKSISLQKKQYKNKIVFLTLKNSTLCNNKEFFYAKNKNLPKQKTNKTISEEEYKNISKYITNLETIYFDMNEEEKSLYNKNLEILQNYFLQTSK